MKVGIDIREVRAGRMTGIGRYTLNFLRHVAGNGAGHTFYLYSDHDASAIIDGDMFVHRALSAACRVCFDSFTLGRAAQADGVDVFYSPFVKAPLNSGAPVVNTVHDLTSLRLTEYRGLKRMLYHAMFSWRGRRVCKRAAFVTTVSEHSKQDIVELWGVPADKVRVVHNVVSEHLGPGVAMATVDEARRTYNIDGPYVLYVGNFGPHKNVGRLIGAFAKLPEALRAESSLVLAGSRDAFQDALRERAQSAGIADRVNFAGFVPDEDLHALYAGASLFAMPSLYEGFGLPPLEAMACGAPVAVANASSLPEVVGDAGVLFEPRDVDSICAALESVLSNEAFAAELRDKSLARAEMFRPEHVMPKLVALLEEAAASRG